MKVEITVTKEVNYPDEIPSNSLRERIINDCYEDPSEFFDNAEWKINHIAGVSKMVKEGKVKGGR